MANPKRKKTKKKTERTILTVKEIEKLFSISRNDDETMCVLLQVCYAYAMKMHELLDLKVSDIDFTDKFIKIHRNGKKMKRPITNNLITELFKYVFCVRAKYISDEIERSLFLISSGNPISEHHIHARLEEYSKRMKKNVTFHSIRRSKIHHLMVDLDALQLFGEHYKKRKDKI